MSKKQYNCRLAEHRDELHCSLRLPWSYRDDLAVIDGVVMKGRCIIIPAVLKQVLDQLHTNQIGIKKKNKATCTQIHILGQYKYRHRKAYKKV